MNIKITKLEVNRCQYETEEEGICNSPAVALVEVEGLEEEVETPIPSSAVPNIQTNVKSFFLCSKHLKELKAKVELDEINSRIDELMEKGKK